LASGTKGLSRPRSREGTSQPKDRTPTRLATILVSVSLLMGTDVPGTDLMSNTAFLPGLFDRAGILIGIAMLIGALEFVGPVEREGWALAGTIASVGYLAWSIWLIGIGIGLLLSPSTREL
jgi:hypothetical protein